MFLGCPSSDIQLKVNDDVLLSATDSVKLLGVTLDEKLSFKPHINSLCKKASKCIGCFYRIRKYLSVDQCYLLLNSFFVSIFLYAPIIWMFCSKSSSDAIKAVHKRALRTIYGVTDETLDGLLQNNNLASIHELHLRHILCEIYKSVNGISPPIMQELFKKKTLPYNLRINNLLTIEKAKTSRFGIESFVFRGSLLWNALPDDLKDVESFQMFKSALKNVDLERFCSCKLCWKPC